MSSYGPRTAFGVGMIHGVGAETGSQALLIAGDRRRGRPRASACRCCWRSSSGSLISNTLVVVISATGFVASQLRQRLYLVVGVLAGAFSLVGRAALPLPGRRRPARSRGLLRVHRVMP